MRWPDEIRSPETLAPASVELSEEEIVKALALMDALATDDIPEDVAVDRYTEAISNLITAKEKGTEPPHAAEAEAPTGRRRRRGGRRPHGRPPRVRAEGEGIPRRERRARDRARAAEEEDCGQECRREEDGRQEDHGEEAQQEVAGEEATAQSLERREADHTYERNEGYRCSQHHRPQHARPAGLGPGSLGRTTASFAVEDG